MENFLELSHGSRRFIKEGAVFKAVDDVSFTLYPGECLGIAGASGSGKSTLARMACGLLPLSEGKLFLKGKEISWHQRKELYREIQMVFQMPKASFDPRYTLGKSIRENLGGRGEDEVIRLLEECGLSSEFADRYPHEVSGGECQRAAIARALASNPACLVCDEATSALDMAVQKEILLLLERLKKERHLSLLFISHDLSVIRYICDHVMVMEKGKIVESGRVEDIMDHPNHPYTKALLRAARRLQPAGHSG